LEEFIDEQKVKHLVTLSLKILNYIVVNLTFYFLLKTVVISENTFRIYSSVPVTEREAKTHARSVFFPKIMNTYRSTSKI